MLSALGGVALALLPMPRSLRHRLRLGAPAAARCADRLADAATPAIVLALLTLAGTATWPHPPGGVPRLWLAGAALGLATGIPFTAERRRLRRRVRGLGQPPEPRPRGPHTTARELPVVEALEADDDRLARERLGALLAGAPGAEALRLAALLEAGRGAAGAARLLAVRAVQDDARRWDALLDAGSALCRRGRFRDGLHLLERAAELSGRCRRALLVLAAGQAVSGRLREASAILDEVDRLNAARRG